VPAIHSFLKNKVGRRDQHTISGIRGRHPSYRLRFLASQVGSIGKKGHGWRVSEVETRERPRAAHRRFVLSSLRKKSVLYLILGGAADNLPPLKTRNLLIL